MKHFNPLIVTFAFVGIVFLAQAQTETQNPTLPFWKTKGNTGTTPPSVNIGSVPDNNFIGTIDNADFTIVTNNVERLRFDAARYMIGIGEQDPQYAIDLKINPDAIFPCTYNGIRINHPSLNNSCNNGVFWGLDNTGIPGEAGALWQYLNTGHIKFGIGTIATGEKMRLTRNGLGINVTSPATQLHITENTGLRNGLMVSQPTTPNADGTLFGLDIGSIQIRDAMIWNYIANGEMKFGTQNTERVRIDANGKVGIATATPAQLLHVSGTGNTVRVGGISAAGTFSTAPSASTDRLLYADVNGDLKAIPQGSNGAVLTVNASGIPEWAAPGASTDWSINGNSGTDDAVNFLGTTDNEKLVFKTANVQRARLTIPGVLELFPGNENTFIGDSAAASVSSATNSTFVGVNAGQSTTTGSYNTFTGYNSGRDNQTGYGNTFYGFETGAFSKGIQNTFMGDRAGYGNRQGYHNVAVGFWSYYNDSSGYNNVAVGKLAMNGSISSINTTAIGAEAMQYDSTGDMNVAVGWRALRNHKTGGENTAIGVGAMEAS
jgi:hypothetical protein